MDIGLHTGASRLQMLENWQATIAGNLANVATPGYQKTVFEVSMPGADGEPTQAVRSPEAKQPVGQVRQSFVDGSIRSTGNPYDMAVQGGGFFAVTDTEGRQLYTKDGEFHLDATGVLVNKMGYTVSAEGDTLQVNLEGGPITVSKDGTVSQQGENVGRISVYEFANPEALERMSGSYFSDAGEAARATEVENPTVLQAHLMGSTVSPMTEMITMIEVSRAYEITQKLIREMDERADRAIQTFSV